MEGSVAIAFLAIQAGKIFLIFICMQFDTIKHCLPCPTYYTDTEA